MIMLILLTFIIPSMIVCSEITPTIQQPIHRSYDSQNLFINYSSSFSGIDERNQARLISNEGHNLTILNNLVPFDICKEYEWLTVDIGGIRSEFFNHENHDLAIARSSSSRAESGI